MTADRRAGDEALAVTAPTTPADDATRGLSLVRGRGSALLDALVDLVACWHYHPGHGHDSAFHERSRALHGSMKQGRW